MRTSTDALDLDSLLLRWSSGVNTSYSSGLKGGIAWAFDPALCDRLVPLFPEEERARSGFYGLWQHLMPSLLRCEHLKATIRTSMRSWEAANTNIRFFEVSSLCDRAWQTPGSEPNPSMPPYAPPAPPPVTSPSLPPYSPPQPPLVPPSAPPPVPPLPPALPCNPVTVRTVTLSYAAEISWILDGYIHNAAPFTDRSEAEQSICLTPVRAHSLELVDAFA